MLLDLCSVGPKPHPDCLGDFLELHPAVPWRACGPGSTSPSKDWANTSHYIFVLPPVVLSEALLVERLVSSI